MIRKEACSDFNFLTVLRLVLCPIIWSILEKVSHVLEKNVYSAAHNYFIYCYFVVPVLGAYIVITIVFLMNFSFIIIYCPFCLLLPFFFCLDVCFVWYEYGYANFLLAESACTIIFYYFSISPCLSLELKWVLRRQYIVGFFFFLPSIHSVILFLSIGGFNSFTFRIVLDRWGFSTAIFSFVFWLL